MNNLNIKLHYFQTVLLKKLVSVPKARFNDLLIAQLESEHMNYHLQKLLEFGLVEKIDDKYQLTDSGKDYSNLMDDQVEAIEKQPKTSVLLNIVRRNTQTSKIEYLLSKRLRQPYLGKIGRLTGKVRFGETLEQAAGRELYEETGLQAKEFILEQVYHKLRYRQDQTCVQDVLFYQFMVKNPTGNLITHTPFQENIWASKDMITKHSLNVYDDLVINQSLQPQKLSFVENIGIADGF